jgi:hypothetical protein
MSYAEQADPAFSGTFSDALAELRSTSRINKIYREGWNGKNMWVALQVPDEHSKMTLPYLYMRTAQGDLVPWLASQTDLLAKDWGLLG